MRFYHISDVHLGAVPDGAMPWSRARAKDIFDSFYRLLAKAKEEGIHALFICGDLFHRQPLKRELKELDYHFGKIAPVKVFIIAGNHDYISADSSYVNYNWSSNVYFFPAGQCQSLFMEELGVYLYGFSYDHYELTKPLYQGLRPKGVSPSARAAEFSHILLAHGGDERHIPISFGELEQAGFDYVALGHIHKPWIAKNRRMAYSGALAPIDKNDEGVHGFIEGEIHGQDVHITFRPWGIWSYVNLTVPVTSDMSWEAMKDEVRKHMAASVNIQNPQAAKGIPSACSGASMDGRLFKITLSGHKAVDLVYDSDEIYELGSVVSVEDVMEYDFDFDMLYEANKGNLLGKYIERVRSMELDEQTRRQVLYYGFNALYKTGEHQ